MREISLNQKYRSLKVTIAIKKDVLVACQRVPNSDNKAQIDSRGHNTAMPNEINPRLLSAFAVSLLCCCSQCVESLLKNALHIILLLHFLMSFVTFLHFEQWKQLPSTVLNIHEETAPIVSLKKNV